jgi:hypothetical protein
MNAYICPFRYLPEHLENKELQEQCDRIKNTTFYIFLLTPFLYILILYIEKKCCKSKYKTL